MIHYHGLPITPASAAVTILAARHACVSYANPGQVALAFEMCQSVILDNGAFSAWKSSGAEVNVPLYAEWVRRWMKHPAFDWCLVPDKIDGTEAENDAMLTRWVHSQDMPAELSVPVWHLHESIDRLERLCRLFHRVALGSSGRWATVGNEAWWERMAEAMGAVCDGDGRPRCKLHGLRMLNPSVFSRLPLSSADSTNVARNIGIDQAWRGTYVPASRADRAVILANRIEAHASASRWNRTAGPGENLQLLG